MSIASALAANSGEAVETSDGRTEAWYDRKRVLLNAVCKGRRMKDFILVYSALHSSGRVSKEVVGVDKARDVRTELVQRVRDHASDPTSANDRSALGSALASTSRYRQMKERRW